jgi:predicted Rossmann-fold nucleotide-binding protein
VLASDAFIGAPGGIGTVLETMMIWQLLQVRHLEQTPLILVGKLWPGLIEWVRSTMLTFETPLINPEDVDIPICVDSADQAIDIIRRHRQASGFADAAHS